MVRSAVPTSPCPRLHWCPVLPYAETSWRGKLSVLDRCLFQDQQQRLHQVTFSRFWEVRPGTWMLYRDRVKKLWLHSSKAAVVSPPAARIRHSNQSKESQRVPKYFVPYLSRRSVSTGSETVRKDFLPSLRSSALLPRSGGRRALEVGSAKLGQQFASVAEIKDAWGRRLVNSASGYRARVSMKLGRGGEQGSGSGVDRKERREIMSFLYV